MNPWYWRDRSKLIEKEISIMAKVKCNHCKTRFVYKTAGRQKKIDFDEIKLITKMDISELDNKYYCKGCRQSFCTYLVDKVFIIEKAKQIGMKFPEKKPNWRDIQYKKDSPIMKFLERAGLVRKITIKK